MKATQFPSSVRRSVPVLALVVIATGLWAGCDSFLDTEPLGEPTSETFFDTPTQATQATNATYGMLRNWSTHVFAYLGVTDIVSDDADKGSTPADASFLLEMDNLNFTPSNQAFSGVWGGYYQGIFRANTAINGINRMDNFTNMTLKNRLLAENRFLRAYYYFFLVRAFGGVPLITEPLAPAQYTQQRATAEEVYAQIEEDLRFAAQNLPLKSQYAASDLGRATKGAAQALLAEVHLFQNEFQQACQIGQEVINSGQYSLYPNYTEIFQPQGENSSESIFEVQTAAVQEETGGSQFSQVQGVRGFPNLGWGFNQPSANLEAGYEPGDPRQQATIMFPWELLPYGNPNNLVVWVNPQTPNDRYNQKSYIPADNPGGSGNGGSNIRRLRYGHLMLTTAEACARSGNEALARTLLNQVRARARGGRTVTLGITPEIMERSIAETVLGLAPTASRVFVRYVDPDSWAAGALRSFEAERFNYTPSGPVPICVKQADFIQSVNGAAVSTLQGYLNAVNAAAPGSQVTLQVLGVSQPTCGTLGASVTQPRTVTVEARPLLPDVTASGQTLVNAIWHERRAEMAMEQHRWFDIIRQGRAAQVMQAVGKTFQQGKHELYPIPQAEVELVGLQQNPGYGN